MPSSRRSPGWPPVTGLDAAPRRPARQPEGPPGMPGTPAHFCSNGATAATIPPAAAGPPGAGQVRSPAILGIPVGLDCYGEETKAESSSSVILALDARTQGRRSLSPDVSPPTCSPDHPIRRTHKLLLSSHRAGGTWHSYGRISAMMIDDIRLMLQGLSPVRLQRAEPRLAAMMRSR